MQWLKNLFGKKPADDGVVRFSEDLSSLSMERLVHENQTLGIVADEVRKKRMRLRAEIDRRLANRDAVVPGQVIEVDARTGG